MSKVEHYTKKIKEIETKYNMVFSEFETKVLEQNGMTVSHIITILSA